MIQCIIPVVYMIYKELKIVFGKGGKIISPYLRQILMPIPINKVDVYCDLLPGVWLSKK